VGNLWSEQILGAEQAIDLDAVRRQWFGPLAEGRRVLAWFDTSFVEAPNSPSTFTEAIRWYADILRLAQQQDELLMVIKPSKDEAYYVDEGPRQQWAGPQLGKRLMQVWAALRSHPRVRFLDHADDPTTVVAASDLTVTYCFSSVSAEALGAARGEALVRRRRRRVEVDLGGGRHGAPVGQSVSTNGRYRAGVAAR